MKTRRVCRVIVILRRYSAVRHYLDGLFRKPEMAMH